MLAAASSELIVRTVPGIRKAVRWNSPFYGVEGQGWFLSYHVFTRYVKVTFLNGGSLDPLAPGGIQGREDTRYYHIYEPTATDRRGTRRKLDPAGRCHSRVGAGSDPTRRRILRKR